MQGELIRTLTAVVVVGFGATAVMDIWSFVQKRLFGVSSLDYRLVGRWIGHFPKGRFSHESIGKAEPVPGEAPLGWVAHYAIGVVFAACLAAIWGTGWLRHPTLGPALVVGIGSIVAPFYIMQPGMGVGIAGSRTPRPWTSRFRSFAAHASFGVGLYLSALIVSG
ncbi:DUF2938 domain-containing protein [Mesorhizobium sp. LNHC232B00]|uniref:DUF2938 domain-containing protein n=2 Tax=Mesorhizobium TaxID=68287 RepID=UPI00040804A2|nr:DUF2938 domain-containing protein [Mesorhizobium sp. LNHC232B00]